MSQTSQGRAIEANRERAKENQTSLQMHKSRSIQNLQANMESELERKRLDWERGLPKLQEEFFRRKITTDAFPIREKSAKVDQQNASTKIYDITSGTTEPLYSRLADGSRLYRVRFDLRGYNSDEVNVRVEGRKILVTARREEDEYYGSAPQTRQATIPRSVSPKKIVSYLGTDGILSVEAPVDENLLDEGLDLPGTLSTKPASSNKSFSDAKAINADANREISTMPTGGDSFAPRNVRSFITTTKVGKKFQMTMDMGSDYNCHDILATFSGKQLGVHAASERVQNGRGDVKQKEYSRTFRISVALEPSTVRAFLATNGLLYIGASVKGNQRHDRVMESILADIPGGCEECRVKLL